KEAGGAVGVYDGMGSKFRESPTNIAEVLTKLKAQNLFYVQGRPGIRVGEVALPSATTDVVIDERPFRAAVDARFDYAEKLAKYQGSAVAVMSARPVSFERLALWMDQLPKKGVNLAPVSQVLVQ
ncbi:MAG: divergent polysaccharide deacetylase family protein, partial [Rhodospirillaceae bacterium]|nr:divergent polysaccharide deacetylase family protein [Rhodospirillaceae bacterium]